MAGKDLANEGITTSIEEIIRLNAAAVGVSVFVGSEYEHQTLLNLANLVNVCEGYGIPVMAVTAVGKELEKRDARYLALSCRIAAELGARVVKTYWCKEGFEKVVKGCPVPVVMAGGPKCESELEVFDFVYDGLQKGSIGINLGRNVWQSAHPVAMAGAFRAIVHEKANVKKAVISNDIKERNKKVKYMRVAMYYNNRDVRIEQMPKPDIGPDELLVKIEASGICGSDLMEWYRVKKAPLVLGHEIAGEIVEAGKGC